jgi:hypothetical protein
VTRDTLGDQLEELVGAPRFKRHSLDAVLTSALR